MEEFWERVEHRGPDDCWTWLGSTDKDGYGLWHKFANERRSNRITWTIENGPVPKGLFVLHHCDFPACCNPNHLWLGTAKDNTQDAIRKGRLINPPRMIGEANIGGGKLTEVDVFEIRRLRATGRFTLKQLGAMFKVTFGMIGHIVSRRAWKHI
jgi:hypothetical protein